MIALVLTVLNEGDSIRLLLESIRRQTVQPDEIVIVDGGSVDETAAIIRAYTACLPIRLIVEPGANISRGRNRAIAAAQGAIIAVTDAGVVLEPDWLETLTAPLLADDVLEVAAGFFQADARSVFEAALGATTLPHVSDVDPYTFLPSSRSVAFRKAAWERVGGYPEWLDYCEDLIFDLRLRGSLAPQTFVPGAIAHFRPRRSLRAFFRQYYLYARGDGKADLWRKRHAVRYVTYGVALPGLLVLGALVHPVFWLLLALGAAIYVRRPYQRLPGVLRAAARAGHIRLTPWAWLRAAAWVPIIRAVGDLAKMLGYPVGWIWRLRHRPPDWRA
ncbi:MAG: glycosyltransferase [Anaerolinea sp.]|nr:glycosyltransferase [Anaerolinea sp.]